MTSLSDRSATGERNQTTSPRWHHTRPGRARRPASHLLHRGGTYTGSLLAHSKRSNDFSSLRSGTFQTPATDRLLSTVRQLVRRGSTTARRIGPGLRVQVPHLLFPLPDVPATTRQRRVQLTTTETRKEVAFPMNATENHKIKCFAEKTQMVRVRCAAAGGSLWFRDEIDQ